MNFKKHLNRKQIQLHKRSAVNETSPFKFTTYKAVDPYNPKEVRSEQGNVFYYTFSPDNLTHLDILSDPQYAAVRKPFDEGKGSNVAYQEASELAGKEVGFKVGDLMKNPQFSMQFGTVNSWWQTYVVAKPNDNIQGWVNVPEAPEGAPNLYDKLCFITLQTDGAGNTKLGSGWYNQEELSALTRDPNFKLAFSGIPYKHQGQDYNPDTMIPEIEAKHVTLTMHNDPRHVIKLPTVTSPKAGGGKNWHNLGFTEARNLAGNAVDIFNGKQALTVPYPENATLYPDQQDPTNKGQGLNAFYTNDEVIVDEENHTVTFRPKPSVYPQQLWAITEDNQLFTLSFSGSSQVQSLAGPTQADMNGLLKQIEAQEGVSFSTVLSTCNGEDVYMIDHASKECVGKQLETVVKGRGRGAVPVLLA